MHEPYFLEPNKPDGERLLAVLTEKIRISQRLRMCIAYLSNPDICQAIEDRTKSGLPTRLILNAHDIIRFEHDRYEFRFIKRLAELFRVVGTSYRHLEVKTLGSNDDDSIMHHKFILFEDVVGFGSLNFSALGFHKHYEFFMLTDDELLWTKFSETFERLWGSGMELNVQRGALRNVTCPKCHRDEGIDFESWGLSCGFCQTKFSNEIFDKAWKKS